MKAKEQQIEEIANKVKNFYSDLKKETRENKIFYKYYHECDGVAETIYQIVKNTLKSSLIQNPEVKLDQLMKDDIIERLTAENLVKSAATFLNEHRAWFFGIGKEKATTEFATSQYAKDFSIATTDIVANIAATKQEQQKLVQIRTRNAETEARTLLAEAKLKKELSQIKIEQHTKTLAKQAKQQAGARPMSEAKKAKAIRQKSTARRKSSGRG